MSDLRWMRGGILAMESVYSLMATEQQVGLPAAILELLGLRTGETVNLTTRARQVIITPLSRQAIHEEDTAESFTIADLAATYSESGLARLSRTVVQEPPADYIVEESHDAATEATSFGVLPCGGPAEELCLKFG